MSLAIDRTTYRLRRFSCPCCEAPATRTWASVTREDGKGVAVYFASCYSHGPREAWIDVVLGTWDRRDADDHVTFGARVTWVDCSPAPVAVLADGGEVAPDEPLFGAKLPVARAMAHPWLDAFWDVVDFVLLEDDVVHGHVYPQV